MLLASKYCSRLQNIISYNDMLAESKMMGAGLARSGSGGVGQGIGQIFSSSVEAMSNNPGISKGLFNYALIGFALTEAVALFIPMITFSILF